MPLPSGHLPTRRTLLHRLLYSVAPLIGLTLLATACGNGATATVVATQPAKVVKETVLVTQPAKKVTVLVTATPSQGTTVATPAPAASSSSTTVATPVPTPTSATAFPTPPMGTANIVPEGRITFAVSAINPDTGWLPQCVWCSDLDHLSVGESLLMGGQTNSGAWIAKPWLASSWKTAPDLSYTDFTLRQGVTFNDGFGEMTAADVAWTFNESATVVNPKSVEDDGVQIPEFTGAKALSNSVVRFEWKGYGSYSLPMRYTDLQEGMPITSQKAYQQKGQDWLKDHFIFTGPYQVVTWQENSQVVLKARPDHWRKVPWIANVTILAVPEETTRLAMLKSGQAAAAEVNQNDVPNVLQTGYKMEPVTAINEVGVTFSGNYWENTNAATGKPLTRTRDTSKPWVGNPFENGSTFTLNTPSMTKSREVREALALAINRQEIIKQLLGGNGQPFYIGTLWASDPLFQKHKDWTIPYDPSKAQQLLKQAGYPNGFKIQVWTGSSGFAPKLWDAIGNYWTTNLNVTPVFDKREYTQFRPSIVARTDTEVFSGCCYGPSNWPNQWVMSSSNYPGGYNVGMELPQAETVLAGIQKANNFAEAESAADTFYGFLFDQWLWPGVVQYNSGAIYNPKKMEWVHMRPYQWQRYAGLGSFEWIKPLS